MKTFSRKYWENQYEIVSAFNPLIRAALPFNDLLTKDLAELQETINRITSFNIQYHGIDGQAPSQELIQNVLVEINDYGHSLVLLETNQMNTEELHVTKEMKTAIREFKQDVVVNTQDNTSFIRMQGENSVVTFGQREYECKHISYISDKTHTEIYLPIDDDVRVFVAAHSFCCSKCKRKSCIVPNNGKIQMYWPLNGALIDTPPKPFDIHKSVCSASVLCIFAEYHLGDALLKYKAALNRDSDTDEDTETIIKKANHVSHKSDGVVEAIQRSKTFSEIIVPIRPHYSTAKHSTGSHKSPVAHTVNGYWRRRSKNDSTLIFVKSFARGGSSEDKESLRKDMRTKQVVRKL